MPVHSVSIDTPTNSKIRKIVQDLEQTYAPEPDKFIYGGGRVAEYSQPGNNGAWPGHYMDQTEGGGPSKKLRKVGKFASDFKEGFDRGVSGVLNPVTKSLKPVAKLAKTVAPIVPLAMLALGEGDMETKPVKRKRIRVPKGMDQPVIRKKAEEFIQTHGGGKAERGKIVSQVMKEQGLSLPLASAYVKAHNLYKK